MNSKINNIIIHSIVLLLLYYKTIDSREASLCQDDSRRALYIRNRIVGGEKTAIQNYPYTVRFGVGCGGTIIDRQWILTAGHCSPNCYFIIPGTTNLLKGQKVYIEENYIHPLFKETPNQAIVYDFQLLKLKTALNFSEAIQPIPLGSNEDMVVGNNVTVTGWGRLSFDGPRTDLLRVIHVPLVDHATCENTNITLYHNLTEQMFCAGYAEGQKDACQGDSGGPAVMNGKLVGVVSFGFECASPNAYGVYAHVPSVKDWISNVTGIKFD